MRVRRHLPRLARTALLAMALFAAGPAVAADIVIEQPWARATPKGASVAAGYLTIRNKGGAPDTLVSASAGFAARAEVHRMALGDGVMTMRPVTEGVVIPIHGSVTLRPMGLHLMFTGLKHGLRPGTVEQATLTFAHAGAIPVSFKVGGIADKGPADKGPTGAARDGAPAMGDMKM